MRDFSPRADIKDISYKYGRMKQKQETDLVVVLLDVEVGTGNLALMIFKGQRSGTPKYQRNRVDLRQR